MRGRDRTSSVEVGEFVLHTDRDHRGKYRGRQAMNERYRGWHYHIEHPCLSQEEIMNMLEIELERMGAERVKIERTKVVKKRIYPHRGNLRIKKRWSVKGDLEKAREEIIKWLYDNVGYAPADIQVDFRRRKITWKRPPAMVRKWRIIPRQFFRNLTAEFVDTYEIKNDKGEWEEISEEEWRRLYDEHIIKRIEVVERIPLAVGVVEAEPARVSLWRLDDRETVLWLSSVTGSLHIEANKKEEYAKSILTKRELIAILKRWCEEMAVSG